MKSFLKNLSYVVLVLGIIGSISLAYYNGNVLNLRYAEYERSWPLTIGIFAGSLIGILALFGILNGISEILDNQEIICKQIDRSESKAPSFNSGGASSTYSYNDDSRPLPFFSQGTPKAGEWKCPSCGRINAGYVGTCACGKPKED